MRCLIRVLILLACAMGCAWAQCSTDHRTDKKAGILLTDLTITGTKAVSTTELAGMTGEMIGNCYNEDLDEVRERLRALFQDAGYFLVEVKNVRLKAGDLLGVPKPTTIEAEVEEGLQYRVGEISFVQNHAFTSEKLRAEFPMKVGDVFSRRKVAAGLEALRTVYGTNGYLDYVGIPDSAAGSNGIMNLQLSIDEGPQYRLASVEFAGKKEATARLQTEWKLEAGAVYDHSYIDQYIEANRDLLPEGFRRDDVQIGKDCPKAQVELRFMVDPTEGASRSPLKNVACEHHEQSK